MIHYFSSFSNIPLLISFAPDTLFAKYGLRKSRFLPENS